MTKLIARTRWFGRAVFVALSLFILAETPAAQGLETVEIITRGGVRVFEVEVAVTEEQQRTGLMFRKELPEGRGMLFDFGAPRPAAMWMRNTYVSLDMLFIRADGTIANIAENTKPLSEATIPSAGPIKAVLEVVAGTVRKYGIAPGDKVSHRIFKNR